MLNDNQFQCANCKGIFEKGRSDEEMDQEFEENFPDNDDEREIICNDCYLLFMQWYNENFK